MATATAAAVAVKLLVSAFTDKKKRTPAGQTQGFSYSGETESLANTEVPIDAAVAVVEAKPGMPKNVQARSAKIQILLCTEAAWLCSDHFQRSRFRPFVFGLINQHRSIRLPLDASHTERKTCGFSKFSPKVRGVQPSFFLN